MGWGASNTTGESASKISIIKAQNLQMRPTPSTNTPSWQPGGQGKAVGILSSQADMARSRDAIQENTRPQRQREIPNNPNFFYNEDLYIQQALQQSLVETHGAGNQQSNDEMFNQLLKDTLIMSKKEYEDIDRKAKEDEILKIKDNPEAMKKKLENLLSNERLTTQGKKLPPLAAQKNIKSNKPKEKKDLSLIKAPILMNIGDPKILHTDDAGTNRQVNDTDSEIDIKENEQVKVEPKVPSYNPKLFEQNEIDKKNMERVICFLLKVMNMMNMRSDLFNQITESLMKMKITTI